MGLLQQYQQLTTDAAAVTADQTKLDTDKATDAADISAFVSALGPKGKLFPSADGTDGDFDLVAPDGAGGFKVVDTYSLAT